MWNLILLYWLINNRKTLKLLYNWFSWKLFFFFRYSLATSRTNCAQIPRVCYFVHCWEYTMWEYWSLVFQRCPVPLKSVETIGNCQRLAFTVGVSQHMHKIPNLWKFELNRSSKLRDKSERKITLVTRSCVVSDARFQDLKYQTWGL